MQLTAARQCGGVGSGGCYFVIMQSWNVSILWLKKRLCAFLLYYATSLSLLLSQETKKPLPLHPKSPKSLPLISNYHGLGRGYCFVIFRLKNQEFSNFPPDLSWTILTERQRRLNETDCAGAWYFRSSKPMLLNRTFSLIPKRMVGNMQKSYILSLSIRNSRKTLSWRSCTRNNLLAPLLISGSSIYESCWGMDRSSQPPL